ncbi:uncharacterized protein LOC127750639, partial [Frankliniella occidentalis]|uniref:Uncharacterized protein LOC127750639 n=1 Tax=Frankliniella occidentalis TaxID=133901 RepID=A0A9C6X402_FRAOC
VQERATTIDALPDELLAAVLALVPLYRSDGSSLLELRLVSKRWKHVVRSEAVWAHRSLSITSLPRSSNMAALRLVPAIRSLKLEARLGKPLLRLRRLADTEECKIMELTVSIQLHKQSADLLSETLQRRRLQLRDIVLRLVLSKATSDPSPVLAALERLPELRRLTIDSDDGRKKPRVVNYQFNNFHKLQFLYLGKNLSENLVKSSIQAAKNTLREAYCSETGLDVGQDVASCPLVTTTSFQVGPGLEKIRKGQSSALETLTVICRDQYQLQQLSTFLENPEGLPCWIDVKLDLEEPDQCRALLREAGPSLRGVKTLSIKGAAGVEARELAMVLLHMANLVSLELSDSGLDMGQLVGALTALHAPALERLKFRGTGSMRWVRDLRLLRPGLRIDVPYA